MFIYIYIYIYVLIYLAFAHSSRRGLLLGGGLQGLRGGLALRLRLGRDKYINTSQ